MKPKRHWSFWMGHAVICGDTYINYKLQRRMYGVANTRMGYYQQQQEEECLSNDEEESEEEQLHRKKKQNVMPRFVKNKINEIDTNVIVLNISKTQYDVVEEVGEELGWVTQTQKKSQKWDVMWVDSHIEVHDLFKLNDHQRISHFPAIYVLSRKNFLGRSLMKMRNLFPEEYGFFPSTWSVPSEYAEVLRFDENLDKSSGSHFYIYKPEAMSQGKGIKLYDNVTQLQGKVGIVQQYVNNPYLIQNLKFDLRIYVLIMGYDPLRVFIYNEGLGRFATEKYQRVKKKNMKDVHMHLTNYAINKNNKKFIFNNSVKEMDKGHKRSLSAIYNLLKSKGIDTQKLKKKIDELVIKTLIVGQPMITHAYSLAQSDIYANDLCFHILGFDVLINEFLQPMLLQVNHTPSFRTDTPLDKFIKKNLIKDALKLLNVNVENKKQKIDLLKKQIELRSQRKLTKLTASEKQQIRKIKCKARDEYELAHLGNFRKIYPTKQSRKYQQMVEVSKRIFREANRIKNKGGSLNKKFQISRYISIEKQRMSSTTSIFNFSKDRKQHKANESRIVFGMDTKQSQLQLRDKSLGESLMLLRSKFQSRGANQQQQYKDLSECLVQTSLKQFELIGERSHRLQKTCSYKKHSKNFKAEEMQPQLKFKGTFISPQTVFMNIKEINEKNAETIQTQIATSRNNNLSQTKFGKKRKVQNCQEAYEQAFMKIKKIALNKAKNENLQLGVGKSGRAYHKSLSN